MTPQQASDWFLNTTELSKFKKHKQIKNNLINQTNFLPLKSSLSQRLWHIINENINIPGCKICYKPVSWDRRFKKYKTYCSSQRCPNVDPDITNKKKMNTDYEKSIVKRKQTNLTRYGHTNYLASSEGKQRVREYFNNQSLQEKTIRYDKVKQTRTITMKNKYGVDNISHLQLSPDSLSKLNDKCWLHNQHYIEKKSLTEIAYDLNVVSGPTTIGHYLKRHNLTTQSTSRSFGEKQIAEFLQQLEIDVITNTKNIIKPLELDIYLPDYKLAIEYCGLYWHSEQQGKTNKYHKTKWEMCKQLGIQLLTIFEDEWKNNTIHVKNKILSIINKDDRRVIYARKTKIALLANSDKKQFLNDNHIQGDGPPGCVNIGLYYDNQIVACMTFTQQKNIHTLTRYATSDRVVGGFSKLLKHFQRTNNWTQIISFADLRWSTGNLYEQTGWILDKIIPPDYYYSPDGHRRIHKFNYRRKYLPKLLNDFKPELSEKVNCDNNGILRIWDCGKMRFYINNPLL